ncbi:MAG: SDR family NAD(P)-dependent oxidoreductase [Bermanella sp.]
MALTFKKALVVGATQGTGLAIAQQLNEQGIEVIALGRNQDRIECIQNDFPGIRFIQEDASQEQVPKALLTEHQPDLVILAGGTRPVMKTIEDMNWQEFSQTWNNDTQMAFYFTQAALQVPMPAGSVVVSFSSGASLNGSPLSGGYAGAKRMQSFLVKYGQREANFKGMDSKFISVLPKQMMQGSAIAQEGANAYAQASGSSAEQFMKQWPAPLDAKLAAKLTLDILQDNPVGGSLYAITGTGIESLN